MELELRVRLSERPVPPGCGQRGGWLSLMLPPVLASLAPRGLTLPPTSTVTVLPLAAHRQELSFPHLSPQGPAQSQAWDGDRKCG